METVKLGPDAIGLKTNSYADHVTSSSKASLQQRGVSSEMIEVVLDYLGHKGSDQA